jgi:glycosyltransferase involved in cell wall biosynthesis
MTGTAGKSILVFYPHNFFEMSSGTHRRIHEIAEYFKQRNISADLISIDGFTNAWDPEALEKGKVYFRNIYPCAWKPDPQNRPKKSFLMSRERALYDFTTESLRSKLKELIDRNAYDFFFNSYVFWANFADLVPDSVVKIIDLHDLMTLSEFMRSNDKEFRFGMMFQQEVNAIDKHDFAISISEEETLVLEPFCTRARFINLPVSFNDNFRNNSRFTYDTMFIGSDNPFNEKGIRWFMEKVYPVLPPELRIAIVGKVTRFVEQRQNITLIPFAEQLDEVYFGTKSVFCPLLDGTGLKVKIVEALSYGKPIVTTKWGLIGILQKENNGCIRADEPDAFARAIIKLVSEKDYYEMLSAQSRTFFLQKFRRDSCWARLDTILTRAKGYAGRERGELK